MSPVKLLVFVAALAVLGSLASGLYSMAHNGEVAHQTSAQWMIWRVVFQGAAFLLILFALFVVE
ncbi:MAG TPA: twin transmembrane helix small protein [Burkholderiales bacterium]|nr:twin transmembrane helix small protein [Burkholderiales bacterium]